MPEPCISSEAESIRAQHLCQRKSRIRRKSVSFRNLFLCIRLWVLLRRGRPPSHKPRNDRMLSIAAIMAAGFGRFHRCFGPRRRLRCPVSTTSSVAMLGGKRASECFGCGEPAVDGGEVDSCKGSRRALVVCDNEVDARWRRTPVSPAKGGSPGRRTDGGHSAYASMRWEPETRRRGSRREPPEEVDSARTGTPRPCATS